MVSIENLLLVVSASIAGIIIFICGIITILYAINRKNSLIFLFSINWFLFSGFWFLDAAAHFFYSTLLMAIAFIPQCLGVPCIIIFLELIKKENVSPIKITVLIVIEIFLLIFAFLPGGMEIIDDYGVHSIGVFRVFQVIFLLYYSFFYLTWSYQTWKKAPLELKRLVNLLLLGSILFSIVTATMYALGSFIKLFNPIAFIIHSIGGLITIIIIWKEPKIIYILPFKAYRVLVVDTNTGVAVFKYDWAKIGEVEENIFSMVLQAIGSILDEVLKKGEVREIQMDRAVLLIQHDKKYPLASVLIASKSSKSLRYGLKLFNDRFISDFYSGSDEFYEVSRFEDAKKIVENVFDFVPEYKNESLKI
ncbi:MAG: hypothetical protein ACFE9T_10945 [Promethearchaeota archaeon]